MSISPNHKSNSSITTVESLPKQVKFVVVRGGHRVSDKEYDSSDDSRCLSEIKFWEKISNSSSFGEKVEAVLYDSKRHRVW